MLRGETDAVGGSVVRVWSVRGDVVGAGFVAGPDTVATCAHVVAEALGTDPYSAAPPDAPVQLDLPLLGDGAEPPRVTGVVDRWLPISSDGTGDIALLRIREPLPPGARMPPLRGSAGLWDRAYRALGFPDGAWDGVWSSGRLRAGQGTGWVQLQSSPGEQAVVGGFSGSAVWDIEAGAVVGMTVAADRGATSTAYLVPVDRVLGLDPELLPCPYQGLAPFTEELAAYFFGRDRDIERLAEAIGRTPLVALAGPSGAGKSSLLRAGLLPRLRREGAAIVEVPLGGAVKGVEADGSDQVLVLDQFEELAARDPRLAREQLEGIVRLTGSGSVRAVLTVRLATLENLLTPALAEVLDAGTVHVTPLDRANLRETILRPAERAPGLDFEPGLVDRILDDAGAEPGQLPLVESLLRDLWQRREGGRLTWRGYAEAGGVVGALAQHAERVVAELAESHADPDFHDRLRRLFTQLAAPDGGGRFVRRPVPSATLVPELRSLLPQLTAGRLLVLGRDVAGDEVVELAHQALIDHWPRLRDWLEQDRAFLAWRAQADQQRERWEGSDRDDGSLLRGTALAAAAEWLPARGPEVAAATRDFVDRSTARQRREVRRWRLVTALVAVLALVGGTLAVVAVQRGNRLADQLAAANADAIAREAQTRSGAAPLMSAQLALAAWRADPTNPAARSALATAATALESTDLLLPDLTGTAYFLGFGDDATIARSLDDGKTTVVTGATGPEPRRWVLPDARADRAMLWGTTWIAVSDGGDGLRIWDLASQTVRRQVSVQGEVLLMNRWTDGAIAAVVDRGAGGFVLARVDVESGDVSVRPLPGASRELVSIVPMPDQVTLVEAYLPEGGGPERWALRTLASDPAADLVTPLPEGTMDLAGGLAQLECVLPPRDAFPAFAAVRIVPVYADVTARTIPLTALTCLNARVSGDGQWLVETIAAVLGADRSVLRLTDLSDGTQMQVVLPKVRPPVYRSLQRSTLTRDPEIVVKRDPTGGATVFAALNDTLDVQASDSTVVRARAVPIPGGSQQHQTTGDGRFVVTVEPGQGPIVTDRKTGAVLGTAAMDLRPDNSQIGVDTDMWVRVREPDGWVVRRYALPSLALLNVYDMPSDATAEASEAVGRLEPGMGPDDPVVLLADGVLMARDRRSGAALGPETPVAATAEEQQQVRTSPMLRGRPGHPGQVVIDLGPGGLQLWDAVAGVAVGTIQVEMAAPPVVARDGRWIAILTRNRTVEVYDLDTLQPARAPIAAPGITALAGFDADGYLAGIGVEDGQNSIVLVDVERGRVAGTIAPGTNTRAMLTGPNRSSLVTGTMTGIGLSDVPLLARDWRDRVCALMDRPFTDAELAALPDGTDESPPCRD
jgi:hypothetical protein